jgi:hypothetical protein
MASPKFGPCESCEFMYAHGLSMHQKCSNYALTNLLFGLCISIWIIDPLATRLIPHLKAPTHPSYPRSATNERTYCSSFFHCFHFEIHIWVFQRIWGCVTWSQSFGRTWSTNWGILMTPKKTRKLIHETMVEKPTQDLNVPSETIKEEE